MPRATSRPTSVLTNAGIDSEDYANDALFSSTEEGVVAASVKAKLHTLCKDAKHRGVRCLTSLERGKIPEGVQQRSGGPLDRHGHDGHEPPVEQRLTPPQALPWLAIPASPKGPLEDRTRSPGPTHSRGHGVGPST